ncbi:MAG: serine/threonine-protein kinase [Acidobacteria bacterium]|nr:serine/threonine-protein kinase [Acidobacteriota bacterium]
MSDKRWRRIEAIFNEAAELTPDARPSFLDEACAGDESLRREVESLLSNDAGSGDTLAAAVAQAAQGAARTQDLTGRRIGPYEVTGRIGEGGMGVVYRARDTQLDRTVAIKVLPPDWVADTERRRRFLQEAKSVSALNHPNIVTIHTIVQDGAAECIVMEYVVGRTLAEAIPQDGLPLPEALRIAVEIADAMVAAHTTGIVHRDLKPSNIMVTESGHVKVLDFGLAKFVGPGVTPALVTKSVAGQVMGTAAYMSPEQAQGHKVDPRTDIFAFGCVLYEMVSGRRAFQGENAISTLAAILAKEPAPLLGAPPALERLITHCLRKDPADRIPAMSEAKAALHELISTSSGRMAPVTAAQRNYGSMFLAAAGTCLVIVAAIASWLLLPRGSEPQHPELVRISPSDEHDYRDAAISPDGKFVAYMSDRGGAPELWLQQVGGGQPVQLTHGVLPGAIAYVASPSFSPDGTWIVYEFGKEVGISTAVIPLLGGEPRELAIRAMGPSFSPDGRRLALSWLSGPMVIPSEGGAPKAISTPLPFGHTVSPLWLDDRHLLVAAATKVTGPVLGAWEWFVLPVEGGKPIPTGAAAAFQRAGLSLYRHPGALAGERILFSAKKGDQRNVWEIEIKPGSWNIAGPPRQLTFGTEPAWVRSVSSTGVAAISTSYSRSDLYFLPMDVAAGKLTGPARRLTRDSRYKMSVRGTRKPGFFWVRSSPTNWVLKELASGREFLFPAPARMAAQLLGVPALSRDGREVIRGQLDGDSISVILHNLDDGSTGDDRTLCSRCGMPVDWTPDAGLLFYDPDYRSTPDVFDPKLKRSVHLLDVRTGKGRPWIDLPDHSVLARTAGDSGWVFVTTNRLGQMQSRDYLVPWRETAPSQSEWVEVPEKQSHSFGTTIYFFQGQNLMGRRFDPRRRGFESQSFPVKMFPGSQPALGPNDEWDITPDGIVFVHEEHRGSVWLMRLPGYKSRR